MGECTKIAVTTREATSASHASPPAWRCRAWKSSSRSRKNDGRHAVQQRLEIARNRHRGDFHQQQHVPLRLESFPKKKSTGITASQRQRGALRQSREKDDDDDEKHRDRRHADVGQGRHAEIRRQIFDPKARRFSATSPA